MTHYLNMRELQCTINVVISKDQGLPVKMSLNVFETSIVGIGLTLNAVSPNVLGADGQIKESRK